MSEPARPDGGPDDARRPPVPRARRPRAAEDRAALGGGRVGLFGEVLVVALGVAVLSLPVVTTLPAMAAGVAHVRRHLTGDTDRVVDLWHDFRTALRGAWPFAVGSVVLLAVLGFNVVVAGTGALPGGPAVLAVTWVAVAVVVLVLLRSAGGWRPGASWREVVRDALRRAGRDLGGTALLLLAIALCVVIVWMLAPLVVLVPGLLALAVVAVEHRAQTRDDAAG